MLGFNADLSLFWMFVLPGFAFVWSFRYFTDSKKAGDFEYIGISLVCGILNLTLIGLAWKLGIVRFVDDGKVYTIQELLPRIGVALILPALINGWICARISKLPWFKKLTKFLKG